MQSRAEWSNWAEILRRFKMDGFVSWLLEAGSPLVGIGAQVLYVGQPFIGGEKIHALAHMLEHETESQAFARYLRGEAV
jgi:hypothetical protein